MYKENYLQLPLSGCKSKIFLKDETLNPTGSMKDRVAMHMLNGAERSGQIGPGQTIIDCTSGNNGIALAFEAMKRGYRFIAVISQQAPLEKIARMKAYNAEVVVVDTIQYRDPTNLMTRLKQEALAICKARTDVVFLDQADNLNNAASYHQLGKAIGQEIENIRAFLGVVGTGGSLCGIGRAIKECQPETKVIAICMDGSTIFDHKKITLRNIIRLFRPPYSLPKNIDFSLIDSHRGVTYSEAVNTCRYLYNHGISAGILSSAVIYAAIEMAHENPDKSGSIVAILGDSAQELGSTVLNDGWMKQTNLFYPYVESRLKAWTLFE